MGNWSITIEGTGPHNNYNFKEKDGTAYIESRANGCDIDLLFKEFVELVKKSHTITHATVTTGSSLKPDGVIGRYYKNPHLDNPYAQLVLNYRSMVDQGGALSGIFEFDRIGETLNQEFMERYGDELFPDRMYMRGPVDIFGEEGNSRTVTAFSEAFNLRIPIELMVDKRNNNANMQEIENEFIHKVTSELAQEFKAQMEPGYIYCPYVPIIPVKAVDSISLQPFIGFKIRYGKILKE